MPLYGLSEEPSGSIRMKVLALGQGKPVPVLFLIPCYKSLAVMVEFIINNAWYVFKEKVWILKRTC